MAARSIVRIALGSLLTLAGIAHLTIAREEFQAQVPEWVSLDPDTTVVASGVAEIGLGAALLVARKRRGRGRSGDDSALAAACLADLLRAEYRADLPPGV